jgi:hypothetical protein
MFFFNFLVSKIIEAPFLDILPDLFINKYTYSRVIVKALIRVC